MYTNNPSQGWPRIDHATYESIWKMEGNCKVYINIVLIGYGASNILCSTHIGVLKAASPATQFRLSQQFVNTVYSPSWKKYNGRASSELQVQLITHIFYAFARYTPALAQRNLRHLLTFFKHQYRWDTARERINYLLNHYLC